MLTNVTVSDGTPSPGPLRQEPVILPPGGQWSLKGNVVREPGVSSTGILLQQVNGNDLVRNDVNDSIALFDSSDNTVVNNTASDNFGGIFLGTISLGSNNNDLHANRTSNNTVGDGIQIAAGSGGNNLSGNKSFNNLPFEMEDDNPNCGTNNWRGNQFNTANQSCIR